MTETSSTERWYGLSVQQALVYRVLAAHPGRVVSRADLAKRAGLADLNDRRCDSIIAELRRRLGATSIVTVRKRGWMLSPKHISARTGHTAETFSERP